MPPDSPLPTPTLLPADPAAALAGEGGRLEVGDGHRLWWQQVGAGAAPAVLVLHGGPGGRTRPEPLQWLAGAPLGRLVAYDQRGCGRSEPAGRLVANTTAHLVADIERLRRHLGLQRWALLAGSWGAVPALAYAAAHPQRVAGLFLRSPFLGGAGEVARFFAPWDEWLGVPGRAWLGPEASQWPFRLFHRKTDALKAGTGFSIGSEAEAGGALRRRARAWALFEADQAAPGGVRGDAGRRFALARLGPEPDAAALASCALQSHYLAQGCFLAPRWWRDALATLARHAPGPVSVVHGEVDAVCDPRRARWLAARLPGARHVAVPGGGHRMGQAPLAGVLEAEARDWAQRLAAEARW